MYKNLPLNFLLVAVACLFLGCGPILKSTQGNAYSEQQSEARIGYYLPKGIIRLQCKPKENQTNNYELTFEIRYVPDFNKFYTLEYYPSKAADDKINITQENGLLTMIDTTAKDQWVEIVKKLASIPKEIIRATALVPGTSLKELTTGKQVVVDVDIDPDLFIYDIYEQKKTDLLNKLKDYGLKVNLTSLISRENPINERKVTEWDKNGVYYRLPVPYILTVELSSKSSGTGGTAQDPNTPPVGTPPASKSSKKAAKPKATKSEAPKTSVEEKPAKQPTQPEKEIKFLTRQIFYLPNGGPILSLDVTRAEFVEKKTTITFNKGMLTGVNQSKPSEILAGLDIPLEVIKAIVSLPTDLIQLKINYSKADTLLLEQQIGEMKARDAIIDYLKQRSLEPPKAGAQRKDVGG